MNQMANSPQGRVNRRLLGAFALAAPLLIAATGCNPRHDAAPGGGTFEFVSPGGRTDIFYDPPQTRGTIGDLSGPDLVHPDRRVSVADYPDKAVVLNLWGQWCGPCRVETPALQQVYSQVKDLGVAFVGINVRDFQAAPARDFLLDNRIEYPSIYDPSMRTLLALGGSFPTSVVPTTLVLDRRHRVAAVFLRSVLANDLLPVVQRVVAEGVA